MATLCGYAVPVGAGHKPLSVLADHTYVTSDDGCVWSCFGASNGGHQICSGIGDSAIANCISLPNSTAGIKYAITGVCHQAANRILFPARVIVDKAKGYWASQSLWGTYGEARDAFKWQQKLYHCGAIANTVSKSSQYTSGDRQAMSLETYLEQVRELYVTPDDAHALLSKETELTIQFRLGGDFDKDKTQRFLDHHKELLSRKDRLCEALDRQQLSPEQFTDRINDNIETFLTISVEILGSDHYEKFFGLPPDVGILLVDPEVAVQSLRQDK